MKMKNFAVIAILMVVMVLTPVFVFSTSGTSGGLIACADEPGGCTLAHVPVVLLKIINFLVFNLLIPLAIIAFIIAGVMMVTSSGNPAKFEKAKDVMYTAVWGIVIALVGALIVDSILKSITRVDIKVKAKVDESAQKAPSVQGAGNSF